MCCPALLRHCYPLDLQNMPCGYAMQMGQFRPLCQCFIYLLTVRIGTYILRGFQLSFIEHAVHPYCITWSTSAASPQITDGFQITTSTRAPMTKQQSTCFLAFSLSFKSFSQPPGQA